MGWLDRWRCARALRRGDLPPFLREFLQSPRPDGRLPWRDAPFAVLDLETGGLDPRSDCIVAIGVVEVDGGVVGRGWQTLVRPPAGIAVGDESVRVHGLSPERLADAPPAEQALPQLLARLRGRVPVAHFADFDRRFLDAACRRAFGCSPCATFLDTARLASRLDDSPFLRSPTPRGSGPGLAELARRLGVEAGRPHDALEDALTCARVLLGLAAWLEGFGLRTLDDLRRAAR